MAHSGRPNHFAKAGPRLATRGSAIIGDELEWGHIYVYDVIANRRIYLVGAHQPLGCGLVWGELHMIWLAWWGWVAAASTKSGAGKRRDLHGRW